MIKADKIIKCTQCSKKANFYYPFRQVHNDHKIYLEKNYPQSEFLQYGSFKYDNLEHIETEFQGKTSISYSRKDVLWLMNMNTSLFSYEHDSSKKIGYQVCSNCGSSKKINFSSMLYFYQVEIKGKKLVASTRERLLLIRNYFAENGKMNSPDFDYPKEFYKNRNELIHKVDSLLKSEIN